ncbi:DNA-processing protein DprA [Brucella intermedia]|uniref:DNA processing protein DprA n=1 Tax=Ochrobactrum sp. PW1 TaxID=1882222 RepID=A0A292GKG9_9HYPH|nr:MULTISPECIES: DNA-processing protein DprA [Brucella/Ochrobactrum group]MCH6202458.1 DNA-processing protein DprA [Brucella ciceri]BBA73138.1 DNA processing protein DprA [Ochrobactrum sp. PW1]MBA8843953.1 DNA processing protein [Ochrobactrum sp. RH1CCR137]MBA8856509.1 DNA processing protein [Ochrobactrum sp. RH1CCR134]QNQ43311.1 DNA-protecting protein DprA [Brucella intermedia]
MKGSANSKTGIRLSDRQRLNWLRLIRTDNIGPVTFRDLILFCGSASSAIEMLPDLNIRGGSARPIRVMSMDDAERELETIDRAGARLVGMGEPDYPPQLKNCEAPPPLVTIKGNAAVFNKPPVAIVGSRNASVIGARFTERLANDLGEAGFAVISGLARGIDAAAHRASLKTGTVAVLAGGLDRPYPPENLPLYRAIPEEGGVLISEMPMGAEPRSRDFPRRNRIIAGLSLGLIVVEAAERSGSLISARMAGDMGRTVFAVPGSPLDPRARGTNLLLKQGATLVTEANDVIEMLRPLAGSSAYPTDMPTQPDLLSPAMEEPESYQPIATEEQRDIVIDALGPVPTDIDTLVRHTGLDTGAIQLILLELDLAGRLHRYARNQVALVPLE